MLRERLENQDVDDLEPVFDVALSFAGEDRDYVSAVADVLRRMGYRVFYDKYEQVTLWGKNLYDHLSDVYGERSRFTVMFVSRHYAKKLWTNHERQSAQARAFSEKREYILPALFDDTKIPGVHNTVGHVRLNSVAPAELAQMIKEKIGPIRRQKFLPYDVDNLDEFFRLNDIEIQGEYCEVVYDIFGSLSLMTIDERWLVSELATNTCPAGPAVDGDIHMNINLLARITGLDRRRIRAMLSRIECLGFSHKFTAHEPSTRKDTVRLRYEPIDDIDSDTPKTVILWGMLACAASWQCPGCASAALQRLDFSVLGKLTTQAELHARASSNSHPNPSVRGSSTPTRRTTESPKKSRRQTTGRPTG